MLYLDEFQGTRQVETYDQIKQSEKIKHHKLSLCFAGFELQHSKNDWPKSL
jgi:hypothetical protein